MNRDRRKRLADIQAEFDEALGALTGLLTQIEEVRDEEQEYLDNMPESIQAGDKGQVATEAIEAMDAIIEAIEELDSSDVPANFDTATQ